MMFGRKGIIVQIPFKGRSIAILASAQGFVQEKNINVAVKYSLFNQQYRGRTRAQSYIRLSGGAAPLCRPGTVVNMQ